MTRLALVLIGAASLTLVATQAPAQQSKTAQQSKATQAASADPKPKLRRGIGEAIQIPSLDSVSWAGAAGRLDQLKGKTVVVLTYVTWCPKCNEWAPALLSEVNTAIKDKPVIVLAVSTDTPPAKAKEYLERSGLSGPNVLHGYDPKIAKNFGFENEFFNYAVIGPAGTLSDSGIFGSSALASILTHKKDLGRLRFVDASMSPELQDLLWPMELGYIAEVQRSLKKSEKMLKPDDRAQLKTAMERFLDEEIKSAEELAAGDSGQRIDALDKVTFLSANFKSSAQGKEAKRLLAELTKDKSMKKEISAKKMYDASMQAEDPDRRVAMLEKAAKQFAGTHYGELAEKAAHQAAGDATAETKQ